MPGATGPRLSKAKQSTSQSKQTQKEEKMREVPTHMINSASGVNAYLNKCTKWLLDGDVPTQATPIVTTRPRSTQSDMMNENIALRGGDTFLLSERNCCMCGRVTKRTLIGTPFSICSFVFICPTCIPISCTDEV